MTESPRFGVLGAGQISHVVCREIQCHPRARLVAASDPHPERLAALSTALGGLRTYSDNEALLADPELDAVFIATPNAFHAPLALAALRAGKHVMIEKPFALDAREASEVVAAAEHSGKLLSVGMNQRFVPDVQRVRELVTRGDLGRVYHAKAYWFRRAGIPKLGTWFGKRSLAGGGALYDIGVHLLDLALFVMDRFEPISVTGQVYTSGAPRWSVGGVGEPCSIPRNYHRPFSLRLRGDRA